MRWVSLVMALLFGLFAILQWNDPDPMIWISVYGMVAILWIWRWWKKPPGWVVVPFFALLSLWAFSLIPGVIQWYNMGAPSLTGSMKAESPYIESVREWGGLLLALLSIIPLLPVRWRAAG